MAAQTSKLRILIADDHPLFRQGLCVALGADPQLEVTEQVENGEAALRTILSNTPDIAILDLDMPKLGGLELARELRERGLAMRIIILTLHRGKDLFYAALDLGVQGYVLKESSSSDIREAVYRVSQGGSFISSALHTALVERSSSRPALSPLSELTPAELRVLKRVSAGRSSREIAVEFNITPRTVDTHRANICGKLSLAGSNALLRFAMDHRSEIQSFRSK